MNRIFPLIISLMLSLYAIAGINSKPYERPVILSGSTETHVSNECPAATFVTSGTLRVDINEAHYSSYSVRLTPSDGGNDIVVPATSATVSIPITDTTVDYVITVDGGDYGTYDGVFSPSGHSAVTLSDTQAMQLVKNRRDSNHDINVYTATVNSLVNDPHYCRIDSLPNYTWATDNSAKKLILVDEAPDLGLWHTYSYYYVPSQLNVASGASVLKYEGHMPPHGLQLIPKELHVTHTLADFSAPTTAFLNSLETNLSNPDTKVIIMSRVGDMDVLSQDYRNWNECAALYSILRHKYNIPSSDIHLLVGNEDLTVTVFNEDSTSIVRVPMPKDFDSDGIDEAPVSFTSSNLENVINQLSGDSIGHIKHLFVFFAGVGNYVDSYFTYESFIQINPNEDLATKRLDMLLSQIDTDYCTLLLNCSNGDLISSELMNRNRVITATSTNSWEDESLWGASAYKHQHHPEYSSFMYYWLSGISEKDLASGATVVSDSTFDGHISFYEAFRFAECAYYSYLQDPAVLNSYPREWDVHPQLYPDPRLSSNILATRCSFSQFPPLARLIVRKSADSSAISWNSPDIWIRNQNDGYTNQQSEHITLASGQPVYVYVKVHNIGDTASVSGEKYLRLYAAPASESIDCVYNLQQQELGDLIDGFDTTPIAAGGTAVYECEWNWDAEPGQSMFDWSDIQSTSGNILPVRLTAYVGNDATEYADEEIHLVPKHRMAVEKHVEIVPDSCSTRLNNSGLRPFVEKWGKIDFPLNFQGDDIYSIEIIRDSVNSTPEVLSASAITTYLQLNSDLIQSLQNGGTTQNVSAVSGTSGKYKILNHNAKLMNLSLNPGFKTISFLFNMDANVMFLYDIDWRFNVVVKNSLGEVVDGQSIRLFKAGPPNGGVIYNAHINTTKNAGGDYTLTETNVTEPSRYEWYDECLSKFDEGKTVVANKNTVGEYAILKVTPNAGGNELFAVASLDGIPAISLATPVPFTNALTINLTGTAIAGMSVRITSVSGAMQPIERNFVVGEDSLTVNTASLSSGQYVVTLLHNGEVVESINVYK